MILGWWTLAEFFPLMRTNLVYSQKRKCREFGMSRQSLQSSNLHNFSTFLEYTLVSTQFGLLVHCDKALKNRRKEPWSRLNSTVLLIFSDGYQYKNCVIHDYTSWLQKKNSAAQNLKAPVVAVNPLTLSSSCSLYSQCLVVLLFSWIRFWQSRLQVASAFQQLHCAPDNETGPASVQILKAKCLLSSMKDNSVCVCVFPSRWFVCFCAFSPRLKGFSKVKTLWVLFFFFFCKPSVQKNSKSQKCLRNIFQSSHQVKWTELLRADSWMTKCVNKINLPIVVVWFFWGLKEKHEMFKNLWGPVAELIFTTNLDLEYSLKFSIQEQVMSPEVFIYCHSTMLRRQYQTCK